MEEAHKGFTHEKLLKAALLVVLKSSDDEDESFSDSIRSSYVVKTKSHRSSNDTSNNLSSLTSSQPEPLDHDSCAPLQYIETRSHGSSNDTSNTPSTLTSSQQEPRDHDSCAHVQDIEPRRHVSSNVTCNDSSTLTSSQQQTISTRTSADDKESSKQQAVTVDRIRAPQVPNVQGDDDNGDEDDHDDDDHQYHDHDGNVSQSQNNPAEIEKPLFRGWTNRLTRAFHKMISNFCAFLSNKAAINPKMCIAVISTFSFVILAAGITTNFRIETLDHEHIYAPYGSAPRLQLKWINSKIDDDQQIHQFPSSSRPFMILIHAGGDTVLTFEAMNKTFIALNEVRTFFRTFFGNFDDYCSENSNFVDLTDNQTKCRIVSPTRFWNNDHTLFLEEAETDDDVLRVLSAKEFPDGLPNKYEMIFGNYETVIDSDLLTKAEAIIQWVFLPPNAESVEAKLLDHMEEVRQGWGDNTIKLEFGAEQSYPQVFRRASLEDRKLPPLVILVVTIYACILHLKRDMVRSRTWLGVGSMACVLLSISTGYGLLFLSGVVFTNMTAVLLFVLVGIGLDETFIITGEYFRRDRKKHPDPVVRMEDTMKKVSSSMLLTTCTTSLAFVFGCFSSIPAVRWLCIYASITVIILFFYQITFFVAVVILDERRISAGTYDLVYYGIGLLTEIGVAMEDAEHDVVNTTNQHDVGNILDVKEAAYDQEGTRLVDPMIGGAMTATGPPSRARSVVTENHTCAVEKRHDNDTGGDNAEEVEEQMQSHLAFTHLMEIYANWLLRKPIKIMVLFLFYVYFALCAWRLTKMNQEFSSRDLISDDSYLEDFRDALVEYHIADTILMSVYFRNVDQMDEEIRYEMRGYIRELEAMEAFEVQTCWVTDGLNDLSSSSNRSTFQSQLIDSLESPVFHEIYGNDIVFDNESQIIIASRCWMYIKGDVLYDSEVKDHVDLLQAQRFVSGSQPLNQNKKEQDAPFFTFSVWNFVWEFYDAAATEVIKSIIADVAAGCMTALIFIPHWSGTYEMLGVHINVVTYVCLLISIGLLIDFVMHILLQYYRCEGSTPDERVRETLRTMGASISMGGTSIFLAVIPLAFSKSNVMQTVFWTFFATIIIGALHGLVFLPVVLSIGGPLPMSTKTKKDVM